MLKAQQVTTVVAEVERVRRPARNAETVRLQAVDRLSARATNEAVMPSVAAQ